ncbi:Glucose/arabinose dehydrogenase, beta-propeller fold [Chitinophaga jiangningensis]|uniref:Glucose/arabinose dehydrogenase, beta-propeller fold n=1 Tax=Chitinophaga jiangningensis TaxID=1419482 RepID=A0A1M7IN29_9BACT|nr:PQQ-dependent sugar dehydrogenase [Chitinophaga jiangningensis]SHM41988.1 Glucose/arabinose dehydrogenase, beta-propeller fold [Chitinophaga jiangningensis]
MNYMKSYALMAGMLLALASCSRDEPGPGTPTAPPVETNPANTKYQPAFAGQTRANGAVTKTKIKKEILTSGLTSPWGIAELPDGRLLVTEKAGNMRIVKTTGEVSGQIMGLPAVNAAGQGGLLGVCLDPDFATNRTVYWTFSEAVAGGNLTSVGKGRLAADEKTIEGATVIYHALPRRTSSLHYGSRILFDKTGNLVISTGEGSNLDTRPLAQSVTAVLGKIIRITKTGQAAAGNPVFEGAGALPELYSIGHRNPQGLAFHPVTGELWECEHGPRGGDEVNRIQPGRNYGWPIITYGIEYSGEPIGDAIQQKNGMEQPVYYWDPVVSPSGMTFYAGKRVPEWENNLFLGALSGQHIVRLVFSNNKVIGEERLLAGEGQRFRDIIQGKSGALYAITDQGRLYRIDRE